MVLIQGKCDESIVPQKRNFNVANNLNHLNVVLIEGIFSDN